MPKPILIWYEGRSDVAELIAAELAEAIRRLRPQTRVAMAMGQHNGQAGGSALETHRLPSATGLGRLAILPHRALRFRQILAEVKPGLVLVPMNFFSAWPLNRLAGAAGARLAYVVHDPEPHQGDYHPLWQAASQRRLLADADLTITLSDYADAMLRRLHPDMTGTRLTTLPLASVMPARRTAARERVPMPVRFLFLGRLLGYKGLDLLSDAANALRARNDWSLTVAGEGPLEQAVRTMFGNDPRVDLSGLGHLTPVEFRSLIASHDVMVCPYREATQSGIVCDAMSDGMPVIATPVGAMAEQIGDGGTLTRTIDAAGLAAAMQTILDHSADMPGLSARALAMHTRPENASALEALVDQLCDLAA